MNQILCHQCKAELALTSLDKEIIVFCDDGCLTSYMIDEEHGEHVAGMNDDGAGFEEFRENLEVDRALDAGYEPSQGGE